MYSVGVLMVMSICIVLRLSVLVWGALFWVFSAGEGCMYSDGVLSAR